MSKEAGQTSNSCRCGCLTCSCRRRGASVSKEDGQTRNFCLTCAYAEWEKTFNGRLHPSGDGRCGFKFEMPKLPSSMYWVGCEPTPSGGYINRRKAPSVLRAGCPCHVFRGINGEAKR